MQRTKLNLNELQYLLRKNGAFSIREVEYAMLEPDGSVGVVKKPVHDSPTRQDLNLPPRQGHIPVPVIADGTLFEENLAMIGFHDDWLRSQLAAQGVTKVHEVFYAEWLEGEGLLTQRYDQKVLPPV